MAQRRRIAIAQEIVKYRALTRRREVAAQLRLEDAAPILLAALKDLLNEVRLGAATRTTSMDARLQAADAAIKSATIPKTIH